MRVDLGSITVDESYRRALACWRGDHGGKADRDDVRTHVQVSGVSTDDDMLWAYQHCMDCHPDLEFGEGVDDE